MKNSKGVSLISVIVTIVIIIIIASITIFTGKNMITKARIDKAKERLEVIYEALLKDEKILGIGDTSEQRAIQSDDYLKIGLDFYAKGENAPDVFFEKWIGSKEDEFKALDERDSSKRTYRLKTYLAVNDTEEVTLVREHSVSPNLTSSPVEFNMFAGVNRPQMTSDMKAVNFMNSEAGEYVEDVYEERWYNYDNKAPNYANVELEINGVKEYFVWIPRYAYKIQDYYKNNIMPNVPASAIDVIFLKETTNFDSNGEILPEGYTVHPAFTFGDKEIAGIWIQKNANETSDNISSAFQDCSSAYVITGVAESHLLKNVEWSAFAYLAHMCDASKEGGSTTKNKSGIYDVNSNTIEYLAAYVDNDSAVLTSNGARLESASGKYKDVYENYANTSTINEANSSKMGDALVETSNGETLNSAWYNSMTVQPTENKPFIARGTGDTMFGYLATDGNEDDAQYRIAIIPET